MNNHLFYGKKKSSSTLTRFLHNFNLRADVVHTERIKVSIKNKNFVGLTGATL